MPAYAKTMAAALAARDMYAWVEPNANNSKSTSSRAIATS